MNPPLTIVIPSRHRADLLRGCLQSVTQHAPRCTEIIVVDDGSKNAIISQTAAQFSGVKITRFARSRGFCVAANAGFEAANAPIVEILNDDTIVESGWADAALDALAEPSVAAVAPLILRGKPGDKPIVDSAGDTYDPGGFAQPRGRGLYHEQAVELDINIDSVSGCAAFYRREAIMLPHGVYPVRFGAYFEDVDLGCRLRRAGYRLVFAPDSRVWHYGGSSHRRTPKLLQQQSCNEERVFWRNMAGTPGELVRHAAVLAGKALRRTAEGKLTPWLMGRVHAWTIEGSRRWMSSPID